MLRGVLKECRAEERVKLVLELIEPVFGLIVSLLVSDSLSKFEAVSSS